MSKKSKNRVSKAVPMPSVQIIAGFERDIFTKVFQGLLKPGDDTLAQQGSGKGLAIYDEIERDCHAYAVLQKRKMAVVSFPWEIDPASEDAADVAAADGIREMLEAVSIDGLTLDLLDAVLKGYAVSEVEWDPETWTPLKFHPRDQRRFVFDAEGKPRLLTPENKQDGIPLPERNFIVHRFGAKNGNPYGLGLGTRLFWPAFFKRRGIAFWLAFAEKYGGPTLLGKYPDFMDEGKQRALLDALHRASQETAIVTPLGTEVEMLQAAQSGSIETYERLAQYMDEEMSKAVLGETLTTKMGDTGSYAASQTHNGVRMELVRADADLLSATLNETLLTWLTEFHFPNAAPPRLWRRIEESQNTKAEAEKDVLVKSLGYAPDEKYIQEKYGNGWVKAQGGFEDEGLGFRDQGSEAAPGELASPLAVGGAGGESGEARPPDGIAEANPALIPTGGTTVQDTALNGAQVSALLQIIEQVAQGRIPKESAGPIIRASFPAIPQETINDMLGPLEVKPPTPSAQPPAAPMVSEQSELDARFSEFDHKFDTITERQDTANEALEKLLELRRCQTANKWEQVPALLQVIEQVTNGNIPTASAMQIIMTSFPDVPPETIPNILEPIAAKAFASDDSASFAEADELARHSESKFCGAMSRMLEPAKRLVMNANSLEEIRDEILELYSEMGAEALNDVLAGAMEAALLRGMGSAKQ